MAEELPFRYVPPVDPNIGRRFGRYVVRTLLGRGGMGAAYLAEHEARAHVKCVIKFVLAELAQNPMVISRYKTETEAVSLLKHDNIVKLLDFGVLDDGQLFMCFEYIEGKSLDRYVAERGGRLDLRKAAYFIFQLCDALEYVHERGVVHRDLKPDNLMIEASPRGSHLEERVKILDFGIAKVADTSEHTGSGVSMGTPRYMAPEQVTNAAAATSAADVFSLATIFYVVITGQLPWGTPESDVAIYHLQKTEAPAWPPDDLMPHDVAAVVMRALSIKPALRPGMRELAIEIAAAIPREGRLKSGTEVLERVKQAWVTSSPPHAQTLPRPVAADPTVTPLHSQLVSNAVGDVAAQVPDASPAAQQPEISPSVTDLAITANVRRRSRGGAVGPAAVATVDAPLAGVSALNLAPEALPVEAARAERLQRPPAPVLAALPTGIRSQPFAAQEPPIDARAARAESVIVAAEIDLAAGTPGPQPYAHSELPAVVVSNTQLSAAPPPASTTVGHTARSSEPSPVLVVPSAPHSPARRKLLVLSAAACALMTAAVAYAIARRDSQAQPSYVASSIDDRVGSAGSAASSTAQVTTKSAIVIAAPARQPTEVINAAEPGAGSSGSVAVASPAIDTRSPSSRGAGNATSTTSPEQWAKHAPPSRDVSAKPGIVNARPAEPAAPDASSVGPHSERKPEPPANRSPDAQANGTSVATIQRQSPSEPLSDKPPRVDTKRTGTLTILVTPWALVWLDGRPVDQAPVVVDVPAGRHRLRLKNDNAKKDETTTVTVTAGQKTTVQRTW